MQFEGTVVSVDGGILRHVGVVDHAVLAVGNECVNFHIVVGGEPLVQDIFAMSSPQNCTVQDTAVLEGVGQAGDVINEKRIKRNEHNLRDLQDNIKRYNIRIIGVPEEEDKKKDHEKILEEIIVENFPKMGKEILTQVQETQRVPNRIKPRRNPPRHILITLTKIKHKEQI